MKSPLNKRILRELKKDWKKYAIIFVLMSFMIGIASGVFVGNDSIMLAVDNSYDTYTVEDGHFELKDKPTEELLATFSKEILLYEQFYKEAQETITSKNDYEGTVRVFKVRDKVNLACIMQGRLPESENEIAIDRTHAENNGIHLDDIIKIKTHQYKVVGLVSSSDFTALFKNNSDFVHNVVTFNIAFVTDDAFEAIDELPKYSYAFKYSSRPLNVIEEKNISDNLVERLAVLASTGGYTADKTEAETLSENIRKWTDTLEEAKQYSEKLEQRGEALQKREDELKAKASLMQAFDTEILTEMQALQNDAQTLQKDIQEFAKRENELKTIADRLKEIEPYESSINELIDFIPNYANLSIQYAPNDLGRDQAMMNVLVYVFIAVIAFVFAITTSNKIREEAAIIGTLKATGYTKGELIRFYMILPVLITLIASIVGNVLGYTYFKEVAVSLYYNSYSLPSYTTLWNIKAFVITTLIPLVLMVLINFVVIYGLMKLPAMKFLRRDLSTSKRKKTMKLPAFRFFNRFRLRILFQNMFDYLTLFLGIIFIMVLLGFSVGLPETINNYKNIVTEKVLADYQTILKNYKDDNDIVITTQTKNAEPFSMTNLITIDGVRVDENVSIYGINDNSKYFFLNEPLDENEVCISSAFADKFGYKKDKKIMLKEKYSNKEYTFTIKGIYEFPTAIAAFMSNDFFNKTFDKEKESFSGYLSNDPITDIDDEHIYTVITADDVASIGRQLDHSMGGFTDYISIACLIMGILVMYLLTKLIIEKNATSISMVKVLGYENKEINSLYVYLTSFVTVILTIISAFLSLLLIKELFKLIMYSMEGYLELFISPMGIVKMIVIVLVSYVVVAYIDIKQIKKIPLTEALKNVE